MYKNGRAIVKESYDMFRGIYKNGWTVIWKDSGVANAEFKSDSL